MKTQWNDRLGHRGRESSLILVDEAGNIKWFGGSNPPKTTPGLCQVSETGYEKAGKWSNTTYEILHRDSTSAVPITQDWDLGLYFPQVSWETGYFWLAKQAPLLTKEGFEGFIRAILPKTAARWDAARNAEHEFGVPLSAEMAEKIREAQARISEEEAAYTQAVQEKIENSQFSKAFKKLGL